MLRRVVWEGLEGIKGREKYAIVLKYLEINLEKKDL